MVPKVASMLPILLLLTIIPARATTLTATQPTTAWTAWTNVSLTWEGMTPPPSPDSDWIGAFVQGYNATYIKFVNVTAGTGSTQFRLLNARHSYIFRYFRGNAVLATSNIVRPAQNKPSQGHLSFVTSVGDAPVPAGQMMLSWTTASADPGYVRYGRTDLNASAVSSVDTYTPADFTTCMGIPPIPPRTRPFANLSTRKIRCNFSCYNDPTASEMYLHPGYLHTATMLNLQAGQLYHYDFGGNGSMERSPVYTFTAPRKDNDDESFTFLMTSDMGIGGIHQGEAGSAIDNDPNHNHTGYPNGIGNGADVVVRDGILADPQTKDDEFIVINGDISYARGWPWIWEMFFDLLQPLSTTMPMMVGVGNHEVDSHENPFVYTSGGDSGGECGVPAAKRFTHLTSPQKMYYSFTHGSVHVVVLSSEHPVEEQVQFFKQDVAKVDRKKVPYLIVNLHRPLFISENVGTEVTHVLRTTWHELFVDNGVDFVYTGHAHYYERLCAVDMDPTNTSNVSCSTSRDRPVYIVDGAAGAEPDMQSPFSELTKIKEFGKWGYSRMVVQADSIEFRHYAAKIATDGLSVELPYTMTDSIRLENKNKNGGM
jgi:hypothetical protein